MVMGGCDCRCCRCRYRGAMVLERLLLTEISEVESFFLGIWLVVQRCFV